MCQVMSITFVRCANYICAIDPGMSSTRFLQSLLILHVKKRAVFAGCRKFWKFKDIPSKKQLRVIDFNARFTKSYTAVIFYNTEAGVTLFHF